MIINVTITQVGNQVRINNNDTKEEIIMLIVIYGDVIYEFKKKLRFYQRDVTK